MEILIECFSSILEILFDDNAKELSSANNLVTRMRKSTISLTYNSNKRGQGTEPWDTPPCKYPGNESELLKKTF